MSKVSILEIVISAQINLENMVKLNPHVGQHPFYIIAMDQLKEAVEKLKIKTNPAIRPKENEDG